MVIDHLSVTSAQGYSQAVPKAKPENVQVENADKNQAASQGKVPGETSAAKNSTRTELFNHTVNFDVDPNSKDIVIKVVNEDTGKTIREIPSEAFRQLSQRINEYQENFLDLDRQFLGES